RHRGRTPRRAGRLRRTLGRRGARGRPRRSAPGDRGRQGAAGPGSREPPCREPASAKMAAVELLLIRHAEPLRVESSEGRADPDLTARGREQARRLTEWLTDEAIDAVWASPLRRAVETATELARPHAVELVVDEELCEWDRDDPSYIPIEELRELRDERWSALVEERWDELAPGLDPARFRAGVVGAVERVVAAHPGEHVA